ncbi:MAG: M20/M25/M40 family metallo-hydrolase, partial [Candidatus Aminicenantes bacterium]|nr:M20/M25/M40 family metallo-hydrolase [Candidatus Aminicenantes bacterium]
MKKARLILVVLILASTALSVSPAPAQEKVDTAIINRIWEEGVNRSKIMETLSYLTDVIGPRIPGSPAMRKAQEWARDTLIAWGMAAAAIEPCGEFGLGWSNDYISVHMTEPSYASLLAYAKPWTLGTRGKITGHPILAVVRSQADMDKWRGKLNGAIVLCDAPRHVHPVFKPYAHRYTDDDLKELTETPIPIKPKGGADGDKPAIKWEELEEFYKAEGAALLVESSKRDRSDYGTVRVDAYEGNGKNHLRPGQCPRIILPAEAYARICRILDLKVPVTLEAEVRNTIYDQDKMGYNVVAEIPGWDKKGELVMLGGHLDSWTGGTGAVDNASGCAVAIEALRILKAVGVKPRRTIRAALWNGEEEGFYGSRGYVFTHFGDTDMKTLKSVDWETFDKNWRNPLADSKKILAKPDYGKISGYFNYDNGSGRIRGIYIQENFQVRPIFEEWMKPLRDLGVTTIALQPTEGTDHLPFDWIGIPGFQFIQEPLDYFPL